MSLANLSGANLSGDRVGQGSSSRDATSLAEYAYNRILELMLAGRLPAGSLLQERRLAELLEISRTPVREALGRLEAESLITRSRGRAPTVSDVSVENYVTVLDMRRILEAEAAARATGHLDRDKFETVMVAIKRLVAIEQPTPAQHWEVDEMVHSTIAEAAGNPLVTSTIRDLRRRTHIFNTARIPQRLMPGASEHLDLLTAVAGNDAELSRDLMGKHLDNVRRAIIEYLLGSRGA